MHAWKVKDVTIFGHRSLSNLFGHWHNVLVVSIHIATKLQKYMSSGQLVILCFHWSLIQLTNFAAIKTPSFTLNCVSDHSYWLNEIKSPPWPSILNEDSWLNLGYKYLYIDDWLQLWDDDYDRPVLNSNCWNLSCTTIWS